MDEALDKRKLYQLTATMFTGCGQSMAKDATAIPNVDSDDR
jgi:hypothetical protein